MKIAIIGQGYVGLTLAMFASAKNEVIGFDLNVNLVKSLEMGKSHIEGITNELLSDRLKSRNFSITANPKDLDGAQVVVIAVPTPLDENRNPDLSFIERACQIIAENVTNSALIINESTSYPGTVRNIIKSKIESLSKTKFLYAVSPERVDPGRSDWDQSNTPRIYAGLTKDASDLTSSFYSTFCNNLVEVATPEIAEAAKLFENTFRQVNIALVNELAIICNALNIPVREVINAAATKPYGFMKFNPSAGVGGHCIPVDPSYLAEIAAEHGVQARFIELANSINLEMGSYIVNRVKLDHDGTLKGKNIQLIGVAYKPNVSDVRETPATQIFNELKKEGANVSYYDPLVPTWHTLASSEIGAEISIVITLHDGIDIDQLKSKCRYIFDTTGKISDVTQL